MQRIATGGVMLHLINAMREDCRDRRVIQCRPAMLSRRVCECRLTQGSDATEESAVLSGAAAKHYVLKGSDERGDVEQRSGGDIDTRAT